MTLSLTTQSLRLLGNENVGPKSTLCHGAPRHPFRGAHVFSSLTARHARDRESYNVYHSHHALDCGRLLAMGLRIELAGISPSILARIEAMAAFDGSICLSRLHFVRNTSCRDESTYYLCRLMVPYRPCHGD